MYFKQKKQTKFKIKQDTILGANIQTTKNDYFRHETWNRKQSTVVFTIFGAKIQITFIFL